MAYSDNIRKPVIDFNKLAASNDCYISINNAIKETEIHYTTFSHFEELMQSSGVEEKYYANASLNIGLVETSAEISYSTTFNTSTTYSETKIYNEFSYRYIDSKYDLSYTNYIQDSIKKAYLSNYFLADIHRGHPSEIFSEYGPVVLTAYYTGGDATARYYGYNTSSATSTDKETSFDAAVSGSIKFLGGGSGLKIGGSNLSTENEEEMEKFNSLKISVATRGGNNLECTAEFPAGDDLGSFNIDLTSWTQSLNDPDNHVLVDFPDNALVPISDFIIEENLKNFYEDYIENGAPSTITDLGEPEYIVEYSTLIVPDPNQILIGAIPDGNHYVRSYIKTRCGDKILVKSAKFVLESDDPDYSDIISAYRFYVLQEASRLFDCSNIVVSGAESLEIASDAITGSAVNAVQTASNPYYDIELNIYDAAKMSKVTLNGITYLLCRDVTGHTYYTNSKTNVAYTIENDATVRDYDIAELLSRLSEVNVTFDDLLEDYIVFAL